VQRLSLNRVTMAGGAADAAMREERKEDRRSADLSSPPLARPFQK
jgi:hypothetical protein